MSGSMMGYNLYKSSANTLLLMTPSRAWTRFTLPFSVLISPLWAMYLQTTHTQHEPGSRCLSVCWSLHCELCTYTHTRWHVGVLTSTISHVTHSCNDGLSDVHITCSTVMLQCYRRQAVPMEQAKIPPSVTLYSLDRSLPNLVWLITSATPTQMPILVKFGWVGNSPQIGEI